MRFTLKNPRSLQYIDYQNVRKTEFLGCQSQETAQESAQSGVVDYAAALRQYHRYGRGRSVKKFCEDEGYDYWKFCKLAREGQSEMDAKIIADKHPVFIEVNPDWAQSSVQRDEPMKVCEIRIRFNNGLVMSRKGGDVEEVISAIRKPRA